MSNLLSNARYKLPYTLQRMNLQHQETKHILIANPLKNRTATGKFTLK